MPIIDITGTTYDGMWTYGPPYPDVRIEEIPIPEWVPYPTYSWKLTLGGQTGTYLETGLHMKRGRPAVIDIPLDTLINREAVILKIPGKEHRTDSISVDDLRRCGVEIRKGDAVLLSIGRDRKWRDPDYVTDSPFVRKAAMDWIMDQEPFIIGGDWSRLDSWDTPQLFFRRLFDQGILLLAPVVNLGRVTRPRVKLTVLPLKVETSAAAPARAILVEQ